MGRPRACDACRLRKIQCDGDATSSIHQCDWCSHHGAVCTFQGAKAKEKSNIRPDPGVNADLTIRLERLEKTLSDVRKSAAKFGPSTALTSNTHSSSLTTSYAGVLLCQSRDHSGIPVFTEEDKKWILSRSGEKFEFEQLTAVHKNQRALLLTPPSSLVHHAFVLPPQSVVQECLDAFQQSSFRLVFPVIDYSLFQKSISLTYESTREAPSLSHRIAKACVLAFLSLMTLFEGELPSLPAVDWDACHGMAEALLVHILDDISLETLQTVLILHIRQRFCGRSESAAMYHAIACRMVFILGGHRNHDIKPFGGMLTPRDREKRHIRLLFWHCYIFDNDVALRTGQPPLISDCHCDLTLPEGYLENCFNLYPLGGYMLSSSYSNESLVPLFPGELRLSMLKHKTCDLLYSAEALTKSGTEVIRVILELEEELENWRQSIPVYLRPTLSISDPEYPVLDLTLQQHLQHAILHFEYHHLIVKIHQASARCIRNDVTHCENELHAGITTSMALCLEASRSTLFYLRAAMGHPAGKAFWMIVFYPTAAAITIFLHVLAQPLDPLAKSDLELLNSITGLLNGTLIQRLTLYEISYIQLVNNFIKELVRLGNCAISRASATGPPI